MSLDGEEEQDIDLELDEQDQEAETENGADENGEVEADQVEETDDLVIEVDGYGAEPEDNLVKRLRNELRETKRQLHSQQNARPSQKTEVGNKPDFWDDCEGDPDKYDAAILAWNDRKTKRAAEDAAENEMQEAGRKRLAQAEEQYRGHARKLGVSNYDALEEKVQAELPEAVKLAIPLYFGEKGPRAVVALAQYPQLLDEVAAIKDPLAQILRMYDIAHGAKMKKKNVPAPERESIQQGSAATGGSSDKELARLEKEADRTGDRTKLIEYRRKMRA